MGTKFDRDITIEVLREHLNKDGLDILDANSIVDRLPFAPGKYGLPIALSVLLFMVWDIKKRTELIYNNWYLPNFGNTKKATLKKQL
jgi:hypothetical protein